ncbi:MAG: orotate phosphoribosyltransferase [candidate division KSB1 bacterium]|nr:orotate phosphoribosyltransferase [candidate division KSB1 bacterium]MDZ7345435.1 orotate phosphoribosyltransferase [candidate division KSB1 bacterium]MDZ7370057.1 orotate phosphoribosyltransferase [candidate division KSB1 bacterium]
MRKERALEIFESTGALLTGHFLLSSGLHSPQYFQCAKVLQYPNYAELFCLEIVKNFKGEKIDCVISPAIGGIVVGQECARLLNCRAMFAERENGVMSLRRGFELKHDERVLVVEDVVTTGGSVQEILELVQGAGAEAVGVGFIVDRSNGKRLFDVPAFSVFRMDVVVYQPDNCPLCDEGIPIVKPGSRKQA